jgi:AcrR family transcriptional regulator
MAGPVRARSARAGPRRGRPPSGESLARDDVVHAAADLADLEGWPNLSLAGVARELGLHATSMYAHVGGIDDLRQSIALLAVGELADRVWTASLGQVGADALGAIARQYGAYAAEHPGRTAALSAIDRDDPTAGAPLARLHQPLAATFRSFGLDEAQSATAHQIFGATINGLVNTGGADRLDQAVALFVLGLSSGTWPTPTPTPTPTPAAG